MRTTTFGHWLSYKFDNLMARGTLALIALLGLLSILLIAAVSVAALLLNLAPEQEGQRPGFIELAWMSLMRTLDPGTMGGDEGDWPFLISMLGVTIGGIFIVSTLIGVLTAGVDARLEKLRKGRSFVVEKDHTLILGWSDHIFTVLSELVLANANKRGACVVVMAEKDKVEMEDAIRERVGATGRTRVVCRTGNPIDLTDMQIVNPQGASSIVVLAPEGEDPDSQVIKTILAITNNPNRRAQPYHIVAEIHDPENIEAARLVGGEEAQIVDISDVISRIIVQTSRQAGLSLVYSELLDFSDNEIYFHEEPALAGTTFADAMLAYETSTPIGLRRAAGQIQLSPPMDTKIASGDKLVVISRDDDTIKLSGAQPAIEAEAIRTIAQSAQEPERILLLGWNRRVPSIVCELDNYVAPGSSVTVVANYPPGEQMLAYHSAALRNLSVSFRVADTTQRRTLNELDVAGYQHVVVLCYSDLLDPQRADARTLVTLLHLRDIEARLGEKFSIVSEMLDDRNRALAEVTKADDFIVSDRLISLILAQVSQNKDLGAVFGDLFDAEGCEIYLKPAADYVAPGRQVSFYTVVEAARRRSEVAIGYKIAAENADPGKSFGVVVNPPKSQPLAFSPDDRIIVLAKS